MRTTATNSNEPEYLTTPEAAAFLRVSASTLERYRVVGGGPPFLKVGNGKRNRVLYRQGDLRAWLENTAFKSTSDYCT